MNRPFTTDDRRLACRCCGLNKTTPELAAALNELTARLGGQAPRVSSGTRCPAHNRAVGGEPRSRHLSGRAADILGPPALLRALAQLAPAVGFVYVQVNEKRGYVHVQL